MKWSITIDSDEATDILTAIEYALKDEDYNDAMLERLEVLKKELEALVDH